RNQGAGTMANRVEERWEFGGGTVIARVLAPHVVVVKMIGMQDDERVVQAFETWFARLPSLRERSLHLFWDTENNKGYRTQCRERLERWQKQAQPLMASSLVLVRSKLMAMAVAIA